MLFFIYNYYLIVIFINNMKSIENTIQLFRKAGYRITPQRRAIFKILEPDASHPNAESVYEKVRKEMPDISRTTVYNTLKEMTDLGVLDLVSSVSDNTLRYDLNTGHHNHLQCLSCRRIIDIDFDLQDFDLPEKESMDFQIVKQQVTFFGYCPDCQNIKEEKR